jgi:pimeloyl-ACP methyl ester carboxylesterase
MIDLGSGPPVVLIPGIQGRWEWIEPAARALADRCRVLSLSLPGEPGGGMDVAADSSFDVFAEQVDRLLDAKGLSSAALCGVSFGGLVAVQYAASRPSRVRSLVLVSTPGPRWQPNARQARFLAAPRLLAPVFVFSARGRLYPEIRSALPSRRDQLSFGVRHGLRIARAPFSARRMSQRLRLAREVDFAAASRSVSAPTLVVTGEPHLDSVVPVADTREYLDLVRGARGATLAETGHIGLVTRPGAFAELVGAFVSEHAGVI